MAIYRNVNMSFWTDTKVADEYTPEDKYFMLYALTNNYTNIIGCYEVSIKQMSNDLGYSKEAVELLINRFKEKHKTLDYDFNTKELLVRNWYKYNWNASPKLDAPLYALIQKVKSDKFHNELAYIYNSRESVKLGENDTLSIGYRYGTDTNNSNSNSNSNRNRNRNRIEIDIINTPTEVEAVDDKKVKKAEVVRQVIDYMNNCGSLESFKNKKVFNFNPKASGNSKVINARIEEGNTLDDFKDVIYHAYDKLVEHEFKGLNGKSSVQYYKPSTIFTSNKMEQYKNEYRNL